VDSGKVHQGITVRFDIAVVLQCTVRCRRYLQVKLNGMFELSYNSLWHMGPKLEFYVFMGPF